MDHVRAHGGDIYQLSPVFDLPVLDFSININPMGMPEAVRLAASRAIAECAAYPDTRCQKLCLALAKHFGLPEDMFLCGNGAADLIYRFCLARRPKKAWIPAPAFSEYEAALSLVGCEIIYLSRRRENGFFTDLAMLEQQLREKRSVAKDTDNTMPDVIFLCNPANPDGELLETEGLEALAKTCGQLGVTLVLDECFCELTENPGCHSLMARAEATPNLLILRAFTKTCAMAGLRLGYAVCANRKLLARMREAGQPWSVSIPAQAAGIAALKEQEYLKKSRKLIRTEREYLTTALETAGYRVFPSGANYLLFYAQEDGNAGDAGKEDLKEILLKKGILIRDCSNYRELGKGYYRISVRTRQENRRLVDALIDAPGGDITF